MERRGVKHQTPFEERLAIKANRLREEAKNLPPGSERDDLVRKARQTDTASHLTEWLTPPGLSVAEMSEYRAYVIGGDRHIASFRAFVCDNDTDAMVWAKQLFDGQDIELWSGARFVASLKTNKPETIGHDVIDGQMLRKTSSHVSG
jgi:hypothetical protein